MDALRLYANGNAFKHGRFYLRETARLFESSRMLLDTALVSAAHRERMTIDLKESMVYEIEVREGSLDTLIKIGETASDVLPLLAPYLPAAASQLPVLFNYIKNAKTLVEWLGKKRQKNINVNVQVADSPGAVVLVAGDGDVYQTNYSDLYGGLRFFKPLKQLSDLCDGERVEGIKLFDEVTNESNSEIAIDSSTKYLYRTEMEIDNLTVTVVGILFDLDTRNRKGRLETGDGNTVSIRVAPSADIHGFAQQAYDKGPVEFSARPLMKVVNGVSAVAGYELIKFRKSRQERMDL